MEELLSAFLKGHYIQLITLHDTKETKSINV